MTSRDRILAAVRHRPHDRVPVCPMLGSRTASRIGSSLLGELLEQTDVHWHVSIASQFDIFVGGEARQRVVVTTRGDEIQTVLNTPLGELRQTTRRDRDRGTTWAMEDFFKDASDARKFLSIPFKPAEPDLTEYLAAVSLLGDRGVVQASIPSAINLPAGWFEPAMFNIYSLEERELLLELLAAVNKRVASFVSRAAEMGVEYFWMYGPEYAGPPLMNPRCYTVFALPFDKEIVAAAKNRGSILHTHMHGRVWEVLEALIESGTQVISPNEAPPMGNVELDAALAKYGQRVCLMGNLDDYAVISSGNLDLVRERTERAVLAWNQTGGSLLLGGTDGVVVESPAMAKGFLEMARVSRELSVSR